MSVEEIEAWKQSLEDPGENYTLGAIIGTGNSSVVYEATEKADGKRVAIKIQEESEETVNLIYQEHKALSELCKESSSFPMYYGTYRTSAVFPHEVWFILELCEEGSIQDVLLKLKQKEKFLKEDVIAYILREVILGLKCLHEQSIIHRDIKAANILITKDGHIKICDFGISKHLETPEGKTNEVIGSPYWMAPELVNAELYPELGYDTRADVWSLGVTAAELGDGVAPLSTVYAPRALFQIVQNPPQGLTKCSEWSQLYNDFISECLEKNPDHRPWAVELVEHPFLSDIQDDTVKANLLDLLNELRNCAVPTTEPEVTIKSESIKLDRKSSPQHMYRDDLATLSSVTEETVLETLQQRFALGNIYTFLGDILVVVNPYHEYPIYGSEVAAKYKYRARCDNAPHIYAVADRAYQDMLHHQEIQNIILTGETGSGKSTAGKHLLWHLANMTASNKKMVERILTVETVMEAFGNAATIFNTSATRHIQFMELTFTKSGKLSGAILWAYCLEKWRVTDCGRNQSNFHIFYYLMDTLCATDQTEKYHLERGKNYEYLPPSPAHCPEENVEKLRKVKEAFNILDISLEEQETIVKILSAILLVGQIHFKEDDETEILNLDVINQIADLLGVDSKKLEWTFLNFCVISGGEVVRGRNNFAEASECRDSLARSLYCRLVDWIVNLINTKLSFTRLVFGDQHSLGILDIPGFECFAHDNTLDQFLVNMTNEQMQFFYNQRVFIWEMQDYEREELSQVSYNYHDNRELLDIVLSKPIGLLAFLDDETKSAGNDHKNFLDQLHTQFKTPFIRVSDSNNFVVAHYSGQVIYEARNFVERNKNFLSPEMIEVMRMSSNTTMIQLYTNQMTKTGNLTILDDDTKHSKWTTALPSQQHKSKGYNTKSRGKYSQSRQMQTIAATMRNSLLEILQKVSQGSSHFVRCIRSTLKAAPFSFDRSLIKYQLLALGIVDSIRVRQLGYSRRLKFSEFLRRYKFLAFDFDEKVEETGDNCRLLLIRLKMEGWAIGKNKVLLKYYNEEYLSRLYENQVYKVVKIQSLMRAFLARKKTSSKFPRLAELRQENVSPIPPKKQSSEKSASEKSKDQLDTKHSMASAKSKDQLDTQHYRMATASPVSPIRRHSTQVVELSTPKIRVSNEKQRVYSYNEDPEMYRPSSAQDFRGHDHHQAPQVDKGYMKPPVSYSVANLSKKTESPGKDLTTSHGEVETGRPPSPRDIAKAFEAASRENQCGISFAGRYKPTSLNKTNEPKKPVPNACNIINNARYSPNPNFVPKVYIPGPRRVENSKTKSEDGKNKVDRSGSNSPEIINPMEEFTNMANRMMETSPYFEPGPHDFQGKLKKTSNINFREFAPAEPPPPVPSNPKNKQNSQGSTGSRSSTASKQSTGGAGYTPVNLSLGYSSKKKLGKEKDDNDRVSVSPPDFSPPPPPKTSANNDNKRLPENNNSDLQNDELIPGVVFVGDEEEL